MSLVEACSAVVVMAFIIALISAPARKLMRLAVIEVRGGAAKVLHTKSKSTCNRPASISPSDLDARKTSSRTLFGQSTPTPH
jgi:hypothetical protein